MLRGLAVLRLGRVRDRLYERGVERSAVEAALRSETELEREFRRRSDERIRAGLRVALAASDPSARAVGVEQVLRREQQIARMRSEAQARRAMAAVHHEITRELSPSGALWVYGKTENHCVLCAFLAGRFWPWTVLDRLRQPLHHGCDCGLKTYGEAIRDGDVEGRDILDPRTAFSLAHPTILQHEREQIEFERRMREELRVREALIELDVGDPNLLAALPLLAEREIFIKAYTRLGSRVSGYWRTVTALGDLMDRDNPTSRVNVGEGKTIRMDSSPKTPPDTFIIEDADGKTERAYGTSDAAKKVGAKTSDERVATGPKIKADATRAQRMKAALAEDALETFEERAQGAVDRFHSEPDTSTLDVYGASESGERDDWLVTDRDRANFHADWAEAVNSGVTPPKGRKPRAVFVVGGGASGKGTVIRGGSITELGAPGTYAHNDPDEGKLVTPEFQLMAGDGVPKEERWPEASARVHEQSGAMNDLSTALSRELGVDFVYDKVGGSGSWFRFIDEVIEADEHDVSVHVVTVDTEKAIPRAIDRGNKSGRHVHVDAMAEAHWRVSQTWEQLRGLGVEVKFWDNNGDAPEMIAEINGDGELVIHSERLFDRFKAKGEGDGPPKYDPKTGEPIGTGQAETGASGAPEGGEGKVADPEVAPELGGEGQAQANTMAAHAFETADPASRSPADMYQEVSDGEWEGQTAVDYAQDKFNLEEMLGKKYARTGSPGFESTMHLADKIKKDEEITVYRAVVPEYSEQGVLPGSFVSESRSYAENHAASSMGGAEIDGEWQPNASEIVEMKVKPSELAWLGSTHEFLWAPPVEHPIWKKPAPVAAGVT